MASPPNLVMIPIVTYEYLFYLPSSERLQPPAQRKAQGYCWGLVPWVPRVAGYNRKIYIRPIPSSGKQMGNHAPHTGYGPTTPS
jgi:hypothetical protein